MSGTTPTHDSSADTDHLKVLGYDEGFKRSMSLWANFALGFTYLSPLVGIYSIFALGLATAGPPSSGGSSSSAPASSWSR